MNKLLDSLHLTPATRRVLTERLNQPPVTEPRFFTASELAHLQAICARLVPPSDLTQSVDVAGAIDTRLANRQADGWRYDTMPADPDAYRLGLAGVDETARQQFGAGFDGLTGEQQDVVLTAVQQGAVSGGSWEQVLPTRFFEELLAETVSIYYAHPLAQREIGHTGYADQPRWEHIGLNERDDRE